MKLGIMNVPFGEMPLEETIVYLKNLGVQCMEMGAGGHPGRAHLNPQELLEDEGKLRVFRGLFDRHGMEICALSCHANPVHPNFTVAKQARQDYEDTLAVATKLGVKTVITFSGCPGDHIAAKYPNWVTCPWPEDYPEILDYQWNQVLIPYWKEAAASARRHDIKIALELHPGFCVYNPYTLLRLREAVGEAIGANVDPSHLFWQGIDPVEALKKLGNAVYHFHAKDTYIDEHNVATDGVLDTRHYGQALERAWTFRTVGYGHDRLTWKNILSTLRLIGYEGAVSIEHEDGLMSVKEGAEKAIAFLKDILMYDMPTDMWWA